MWHCLWCLPAYGFLFMFSQHQATRISITGPITRPSDSDTSMFLTPKASEHEMSRAVRVREILPDPERLPTCCYHSIKSPWLHEESHEVFPISEHGCCRFFWGCRWCRTTRQRRVADEWWQGMAGVLCIILRGGGCAMLLYICNAAEDEGHWRGVIVHVPLLNRSCSRSWTGPLRHVPSIVL